MGMRVKGVILYAKLVDSGCVMLLSVESFVVGLVWVRGEGTQWGGWYL